MKVGDTVLVVDAGGGTVDLVAHDAGARLLCVLPTIVHERVMRRTSGMECAQIYSSRRCIPETLQHGEVVDTAEGKVLIVKVFSRYAALGEVVPYNRAVKKHYQRLESQHVKLRLFSSSEESSKFTTDPGGEQVGAAVDFDFVDHQDCTIWLYFGSASVRLMACLSKVETFDEGTKVERIFEFL